MDYVVSKALQHSWTALVFAPLAMVPLCFVFQAKYRKSLLGFALSKETYLFPRTPPSSYPLWISTGSRLWSGLSERNSGPELMSLLWSKSNAIYRHSPQPVPNAKHLTWKQEGVVVEKFHIRMLKGPYLEFLYLIIWHYFGIEMCKEVKIISNMRVSIQEDGWWGYMKVRGETGWSFLVFMLAHLPHSSFSS